MIPAKMTLEITGESYVLRLLDSEENELWATKHKMNGYSSATGDKGNKNICESDIGKKYPYLAMEIDDYSFFPFSVAAQLALILEDQEV